MKVKSSSCTGDNLIEFAHDYCVFCALMLEERASSACLCAAPMPSGNQAFGVAQQIRSSQSFVSSVLCPITSLPAIIQNLPDKLFGDISASVAAIPIFGDECGFQHSAQLRICPRGGELRAS